MVVGKCSTNPYLLGYCQLMWYLNRVIPVHEIDRDTSLHTHSQYAQPKCFQERFQCRLLLQEMPKLEENVPHMWKVYSLLAWTSTISQ